MVKTWTSDHPKAKMMEQKRNQIVSAAEKAFLEFGYAESSVNRIAADAGVSIKTLYRHFQSKDELFFAVMMTACTPFSIDEIESLPDWFSEPLEKGLIKAGTEYLKHALSAKQVSLYRVLTHDAVRFPELAKRYQSDFIGYRQKIFSAYLDKALSESGICIENKKLAESTFSSLLKSELFDEVILGLATPADEDILFAAEQATSCFIHLMDVDYFKMD